MMPDTDAMILKECDPTMPADRNDRREATRARIIEATSRLIGHQHGLSVRIEEICARAGISRGTFYNYFQSIDDLFVALSADLTHDFNRIVLDCILKFESFARQTYAAQYYYLERAASDPEWGWIMVHISAYGPIFGEETSQAALVSIEQGIANGEYDISDPVFGRDLALGTCLAAINTQLRQASPACRPGDAARYILRGLGVPDARIREIIADPLPSLSALSLIHI